MMIWWPPSPPFGPSYSHFIFHGWVGVAGLVVETGIGLKILYPQNPFLVLTRGWIYEGVPDE